MTMRQRIIDRVVRGPDSAPGWPQFAVAIGSVAVIVLVKMLIRPLARPDEASLGFFAAVMISAWYGGLWPGLVATALSAMASDYFFLHPVQSLSVTHPNTADYMRLAQFVVEGGLISVLGGSLRAARARAEANARDASEAQARAEEANRSKDEFLAAVSHDLRTPLNAILGWTSVLRTPGATMGDLAEGMDAIERSAKSQSHLIEDLLDVSRIVGGRMRLSVRPVVLRDVVAAGVETVRAAADAKGVALETDLQHVGIVSGDPERLQQVVWNLVSNAIKFTPAGGHVTVSLHSEGARAVLRVSDTGEGIDPEFAPHLFERFRQAQKASRRKGGLGLGLSIVRHLVEAHGGRVAAESESRGKGSVFTVELPLTHGRRISPAPGTPGEGWGGGCLERDSGQKSDARAANPHPDPLPEYRERGIRTAAR